MHLMAYVFTGGKLIYLSVLQLQAGQHCVKDTLSFLALHTRLIPFSPLVEGLRHMSFRDVQGQRQYYMDGKHGQYPVLLNTIYRF